jgi:GT2 family glycosyltransferase
MHRPSEPAPPPPRTAAASPTPQREPSGLLHLLRRSVEILRAEGTAALARKVLWRLGALFAPGQDGHPLSRSRHPGGKPRTAHAAPPRRTPAAHYRNWMARNTPTNIELTRQRELARSLPCRPLLSVVVPVHDPPPDVLRAALDSVLGQTYERWELCAADSSADPDVAALLQEYLDRDPRLRVRSLPRNLGIAGNTNEALALARGDFVLFLDHDDCLSPDALFEIVDLLNSRPEIDIIYYDEDKLSADGKTRHDPLFKPAWSPELLIAVNYLTHATYRRSLVREVGGLDLEYDGAQDWDLALRCSERTTRIGHVPKVLYHWRQLEGSTAGAFDSKDYVFERQLRCVRNHLERRGIGEAEVSFVARGRLRAVWPVSGARVSIIIPTKDKLSYLERCVSSILERTAFQDFELILVDNGSEEPETLAYYESIEQDPRIRRIDYPEPFNWSAANNRGAESATGDTLLFLNNDIEILEPDWLEEMLRWVELPSIGAVGAKLLSERGSIQHAGVIVGMEGHASHVFYGAKERHVGPFGPVDWYRNLSAVTGACMMVPRDLFERAGRFDEHYELVFSDIEFCLRIRAMGYRVLYTPHARLRHYEGCSRGSHIPPRDIQVGFEHFLDLVRAGDPYFNPNLSYSHRIPRVAGPHEEDRVGRLRRLLDHSLHRGRKGGPPQ